VQLRRFRVSRPIEYPLNPTDNMLLATHESLRRRGYCGLNVILIADVFGPLDPGQLAAAVRRLGRRHPALSARIHYSPLLRRASWRIDADTDLAEAIDYVYCPMDAKTDDFHEPLRAALADSLDPASGPQVRLVHIEQGRWSHRLALRWPQYLMDLEGAHVLLGDLDAVLRGDTSREGSDPTIRPLSPYPCRFPVSLLRVWQGWWRYPRCFGVHQPWLVTKPETPSKSVDFVLRSYAKAFCERFKASAVGRTSPGPQRYTRHLLAGIARTYWRMCHERGRPRDKYHFSYAVSTPRPGGRPALHGNWQTFLSVILKEAELEETALTDAAISRQLQDYTVRHHDEANWHMLRALQRWPFPAARSFLDRQMSGGAAGVTGYCFDESVTQFGEAQITNLSFITTMNCHPGWLVAHSMFGERMSVSISYHDDELPSRLAGGPFHVRREDVREHQPLRGPPRCRQRTGVSRPPRKRCHRPFVRRFRRRGAGQRVNCGSTAPPRRRTKASDHA
jgi:hypothetical protein